MNIKKFMVTSIATLMVGGSPLSAGASVVSENQEMNSVELASTRVGLNAVAPGEKSQTTRRMPASKSSTITININASKGGNFTYTIFKNGAAWKTFTGNGSVARVVKPDANAGYSVRAYQNVSGQNFTGSMIIA